MRRPATSRTAIAFQRRADAILEAQLALNLAVGSERQKLAFVSSVSERTDRTISLHLREAPGESGRQLRWPRSSCCSAKAACSMP